MKIVIVGAGSMGCLLGGYLCRAGHDVFLLDNRPERVAPIQEKGLIVEGVGGDFDCRPSAGVSVNGLTPPSLVLVCVKSYDSERAARTIAEIIGPETAVLTLQNGVGNIEQLTHHIPREQLIVGTTALGANLLRPGHVHHAGEGETHLGVLEEGPLTKAHEIAELLTKVRLPATVENDIMSLIWSKLAVNVGINALTAILRVRNGRLLTLEGATQIMDDAVQECLAVATASGIELDADAVLHRVKEVARLTASNRSSMLSDRLAGQRTEIDAINGAVVKRGHELEVPCPVNQTLTRIVHAIEELAEQGEK